MNLTRRVLVFAGDSITDADHRNDLAGLGNGYVRLIAARLDAIQVVNAGVSGDRVRDLRRRWESDVLAPGPTTLTVLIGVNDVWRRYDSDDPTDPAQFERDYRAILDAAVEHGVSSLILMEPFLVPVDQSQLVWRDEDLTAKVEVTRRLATAFGAELVPLDVVLNDAARESGAVAIASDGVHPTPRGHQIIAEHWLQAMSALQAG